MPPHRRWLLPALAALVAGAAALYGLRSWLDPVVDVVTVQRRDLVQTVVASGHVESAHRVDIGVPLTGTVAQVPVAEGQTVTAGTVLLRLDSTELSANLRSAELAVMQAEGRLRQMRELQAPVAEQALRQAEVTRLNARDNLLRQRDLAERGFIGDAALDEARKAVVVADAQWRSARQQLDTVQDQGSDRALAELALVQARANADAARARLAFATVRAPVAGTLIARNVEAGDVVQPGKVLMTLSPAGAPQLLADIDEKNLHLLQLGQPALASADADPQHHFAAVLAYINPGVNLQTGAVAVKLDLPQPPATLRQDMTVSVDIEVARRPQALLLPGHAVQAADTATPWVWRIEGGRVHRQPVRLGLRSSGWIEVLDGLVEGQQVLPAGAHVAALTEGDRVRPRLAAASGPAVATAQAGGAAPAAR